MDELGELGGSAGVSATLTRTRVHLLLGGTHHGEDDEKHADHDGKPFYMPSVTSRAAGGASSASQDSSCASGRGLRLNVIARAVSFTLACLGRSSHLSLADMHHTCIHEGGLHLVSPRQTANSTGHGNHTNMLDFPQSPENVNAAEFQHRRVLRMQLVIEAFEDKAWGDLCMTLGEIEL